MNLIISRLVALIALAFLLSSCSISENFSRNLSRAVHNSDDINTIADGLPAYLILIDSMLEDDPEDISMLNASASLTNAYAGIFVNDLDRQKRMVQKAFNRASKAMCLYEEKTCDIANKSFDELQLIVKAMDEADISMLYVLGSAWASWIQVNKEDWNAIAKIASVKLIMNKIVELNEFHENASAHLYLGVLNSLIPSVMGGKPELGKQHFEKAIALSNNKNLMAKVLYAKHYSRLIYDRELHDKLLDEVLSATTRHKGMTLINTLAQQQARELKASADDYF